LEHFQRGHIAGLGDITQVADWAWWWWWSSYCFSLAAFKAEASNAMGEGGGANAQLSPYSLSNPEKRELKPVLRSQGGAEQCSLSTSAASFPHSPWAVPGLVVAEPAVPLSEPRVRRQGLQASGALSVVASLILTRQQAAVR